MPASNSRASLDRALARRGEDVVLRRRIGTAGTFVEITLRASVRGFAPHELNGGIVQGDARIIASPSAIVEASATWPGMAGGSPWPKVQDQIVAQGRVRTVQGAHTVFEGDEPVRLEMTVRG